MFYPHRSTAISPDFGIDLKLDSDSLGTFTTNRLPGPTTNLHLIMFRHVKRRGSYSELRSASASASASACNSDDEWCKNQNNHISDTDGTRYWIGMIVHPYFTENFILGKCLGMNLAQLRAYFTTHLARVANFIIEYGILDLKDPDSETLTPYLQKLNPFESEYMEEFDDLISITPAKNFYHLCASEICFIDDNPAHSKSFMGALEKARETLQIKKYNGYWTSTLDERIKDKTDFQFSDEKFFFTRKIDVMICNYHIIRELISLIDEAMNEQIPDSPIRMFIRDCYDSTAENKKIPPINSSNVSIGIDRHFIDYQTDVYNLILINHRIDFHKLIATHIKQCKYDKETALNSSVCYFCGTDHTRLIEKFYNENPEYYDLKSQDISDDEDDRVDDEYDRVEDDRVDDEYDRVDEYEEV